MKRALPFVLLALTLTANAQIVKKGNAYLLRAKYTAGQKMSYAMSSNAAIPGMAQPMKSSSPIIMQVKSVSKGVASLDVTTGPAMLNGKKQGDAVKQSVKVDTRNKAVGGLSNFEGFSSFEFPAMPVAIGGSWSGKMKINSPMGAISLNAKYTLVGLKTVNGKPMAEIRSKFSGVMMGPITGTSVSLLLVNDGSLYSSNAKTNTEFNMGGEGKPTKISATITVKRV